MRIVYVAAKFEEYERARAMMDYASSLGFEVGYDWTRTDAFDEDGHPSASDADLSEEVRRRHATSDLEGVRRSDLVIVLGHPSLCGALVEVGIALADDTPVWTVGEMRDSVFWALPNVTHFESEEDAHLGLVEVARTPKVSSVKLPADGSIVHVPSLLREAFVISTSEARRCIEQGGVRVSRRGEKAERVLSELDERAETLKGLTLSLGKRRKVRLT